MIHLTVKIPADLWFGGLDRELQSQQKHFSYSYVNNLSHLSRDALNNLSHLSRRTTQLRKSISVEHHVAITLWCLATCGEYRSIAHLFGVARCTVCVIVHDTCKAIVDVLLKNYIKFHKEMTFQMLLKALRTSGV